MNQIYSFDLSMTLPHKSNLIPSFWNVLILWTHDYEMRWGRPVSLTWLSWNYEEQNGKLWVIWFQFNDQAPGLGYEHYWVPSKTEEQSVNLLISIWVTVPQPCVKIKQENR